MTCFRSWPMIVPLYWLTLLINFLTGSVGATEALFPSMQTDPPALVHHHDIPSGTEASPGQLVTPVQVVENLHVVLVKVMQNAQKLSWQERYDLLHPALVRVYSFSNMARVAAGSYWKTFTDSQKENVIKAFSRMSVATYASRFGAYGGERFETMTVTELPQRGVMVQTRLVKTNGTVIKLSYRLAETEEGWKIVDVFYRGAISELANQRTQYLAVLNRAGYDGLLQRLNEKVHRLAVGQEMGDIQ